MAIDIEKIKKSAAEIAKGNSNSNSNSNNSYKPKTNIGVAAKAEQVLEHVTRADLVLFEKNKGKVE